MFIQKKYLILFTVIFIAAAFYCYNPFTLYFQNDDFIHIPLSRDGVLLQRNSFRPICDLSIMLDYYLWGKNAYGYHLTNLLLHIICTILVFSFTKSLCKKYKLAANYPFAFITSFIFFLYPMHSEAVFWVLGRSAILGCVFFLLCCIFFIKREQKMFFLLSILSALAAWLSYESAWVLPIILLIFSLVDIKMKYSAFKKELLFISTIIIFFLIYIIVRNYFINEVVGQYEAGGFLSFNIQILATNLFKLMMRSLLPPFANSVWPVILFVLIAAAFALFYLRLKEKNIKLFFPLFIIFWLIALTPCASLGVDTKGTEGERFLYLPSIFVCMIISFFIHHAFTKKGLQKIILALLIIFYSSILYINAGNYRLAGNIAKTTIDEINKLKGKQTLYVQNLPQAQKGALIFRAGLPEAVKWLKNPGSIDTVVICSQMPENTSLQNPYLVKNNVAPFLTCKDVNLMGLKNDVGFIFTDSSLIISR